MNAINKTITAANYNDLKTIRETKEAMKGKPVIVVIMLANRLSQPNLKKMPTLL